MGVGALARLSEYYSRRRCADEGPLCRGRYDGEEEVVSCYEAADRGERIAGVEGGGTGEARLDHIGRICCVACGLQLDPHFRKSCSSGNVMVLDEELVGERKIARGC